MVLTWEANILVAPADAETNWKHDITPDWGDLIMTQKIQNIFFSYDNSARQGLISLTHWSRDKMAAISQTTHSNAFSWIKILEIRLIFHWSLFLGVESSILHHWFRYWLGADQATSHYLNQWWLDYWRIYASLGLNELMWPSDVTLHCRSWSTLVQVMACFPMVPSH